MTLNGQQQDRMLSNKDQKYIMTLNGRQPVRMRNTG